MTIRPSRRRTAVRAVAVVALLALAVADVAARSWFVLADLALLALLAARWAWAAAVPRRRRQLDDRVLAELRGRKLAVPSGELGLAVGRGLASLTPSLDRLEAAGLVRSHWSRALPRQRLYWAVPDVDVVEQLVDGCSCPAGMRYHANNCPVAPGQLQAARRG